MKKHLTAILFGLSLTVLCLSATSCMQSITTDVDYQDGPSIDYDTVRLSVSNASDYKITYLSNNVSYYWNETTKTIFIEGIGRMPNYDYDKVFSGRLSNDYIFVIAKGITHVDNDFRAAYEDQIYYTRETIPQKDFTCTVDENARTVTVTGWGQLSDELLLENPELANKLLNRERLNYTLKLGDGVSGACDCLFGYRNILFSKDIRAVEHCQNHPVPSWGRFQVSEDNPYFTDYYDCLYSKDYVTLYYYPSEQRPNKFHWSLQKIGGYAFNGYRGFTRTEHTTVIPWGVTDIGQDAFSFAAGGNFVIPDTAIQLGPMEYSYDNAHWIPSRHNPTAWEKWHDYYSHLDTPANDTWLERPEVNFDKPIDQIPADNIASYYGLQPNTLKTAATGKLYYFDETYKMAHGWTQVNGDWYYFNDYGAAAVKCWMEKNGSRYFLQSDGAMAKNKWINWYDSWYYVGPDGAMYQNRYTPDGYWVNAAGMWV